MKKTFGKIKLMGLAIISTLGLLFSLMVLRLYLQLKLPVEMDGRSMMQVSLH